MAIDQNQLKQALSDPSLSALTDDAVNALPGFGVAQYTPRTGDITIKTLSAKDVWGFEKTASFQSQLDAAIVAGGTLGAQAKTFNNMLNGPGFDATDPQVQGLAPTFVTLGNGTITNTDASIALGIPSFKAGSATQTSDITAARAAMALQASEIALELRIQQLSIAAANAGMQEAQTAFAGGSLASESDINAAIAAAVARGI